MTSSLLLDSVLILRKTVNYMFQHPTQLSPVSSFFLPSGARVLIRVGFEIFVCRVHEDIVGGKGKKVGDL